MKISLIASSRSSTRGASFAAIGAALLVIVGCSEVPDVTGPNRSSHPVEGQPTVTTAARRVAASGTFAALVDFSTLTLTSRGRNCLLEVNGQLVFSGTIEGTGTGRTSALVFASCDEVASTPPGTYPDVFRSRLVFEGTIGGEPAAANLLYRGRVQPGGQIEGRLVFSNGVRGRLEAEAMVAVGGEYRGAVVIN